MKLNGEVFQNGSTCRGMSFVALGAALELSEITISGRYPESGWAMNHEVHELAYVAQGSGTLAIRGEGQTKLATGDVTSVAPGQQFAWEGDMTMIVALTPPFNGDQYEYVVDKTLSESWKGVSNEKSR